jgi:hypothetical protein
MQQNLPNQTRGKRGRPPEATGSLCLALALSHGLRHHEVILCTNAGSLEVCQHAAPTFDWAGAGSAKGSDGMQLSTHPGDIASEYSASDGRGIGFGIRTCTCSPIQQRNQKQMRRCGSCHESHTNAAAQSSRSVLIYLLSSR